MIQEARLRIEHNKQRHRLKQLLATAADGGASVKTQDLMLACELAKMPMDEEAVIPKARGPSASFRRRATSSGAVR
jgi:hypothetical protein